MRIEDKCLVLVLASLLAGAPVCAADPARDTQDFDAAPLQGGVKQSDSTPLQGAVKVIDSTPLQGAVKRNASPLQGGVDDVRLQPGFGKLGRVPLQGNVDKSGALRGSAQDSGGVPLKGHVNDRGNPSFGAMVPGASAIMKIVQFKQKAETVTASPPPITPQEIENARFRDKVDTSRFPARVIDNPGPPPVRGNPDGKLRPQRTSNATVPHAESISQPQLKFVTSHPPVREVSELVPRPVRPYLDPAPAPPLDLPTVRVSRRPDTTSYVNQPDLNTRLLQPEPNPNLVAIPQTASPNLIPIAQNKKKREKHHNDQPGDNKQIAGKPVCSAPVDEELLWDRWYAHINDLVCQALLKTMPRYGNPAGSNRIRVTVWPDDHLEANIIEGANNNFNQAILEAYRSLSGSKELNFPPGTRRRQNTYETAHIQEIQATTAAFDSTLVRGDVESFVK